MAQKVERSSFWRLLQIYNHLPPFSNHLITLSHQAFSLSLFLRNYRCSKALFNLTLPSELKWLRTPLQVLRIWILIMIFWIILDWIFTFHQNLISLLFIILFWDFIFWSFELVFQWKIVSLLLGVFYFIWFFFMGLFMLCSFFFCCSVLAFVYFLTWNFSSLLIYRHVFGIRYLIRIKDLILYDCFYWHSVCKICFLYLKFCGGHIRLVIGNWFGKSWRGYLQKPLNLIEKSLLQNRIIMIIFGR